MGARSLVVEVAERVVFADDEKVIREWIVTTDTGYRAVIPECPCGLLQVLGVRYADGEIVETYTAPKTNCTCTSEACRGNYTRAQRKRLCHGWHRARVDLLVEQLRGSRRPRGARAVGVPMSAYREGYFVPLGGAA